MKAASSTSNPQSRTRNVQGGNLQSGVGRWALGVGRCRRRRTFQTAKRHSAARAGFTLIEVLLAAAILGVGLGMMMTAASRCLAAMKQARKYQEAQWTLNMGLLDHPLMPTDDIEDWNVSGEEYDNGLVFSRQVEEEEVDEEDGLFIVRSRVTWSARGREGYEEVVSYALNLEAIDK